MKKFLLSYLTGLGMMVVSLLLLAGCQPESVAPVEAAPPNDARSQAATVGINPADRKFYSGWHLPGAAVAGEVGVPPNIHPADRKFIPAASIVSEELEALVNLAPADRKFYGGAYVWSSEVVVEADSPQGVDPADRKFYDTGNAASPEMVHPADRKFLDR